MMAKKILEARAYLYRKSIIGYAEQLDIDWKRYDTFQGVQIAVQSKIHFLVKRSKK